MKNLLSILILFIVFHDAQNDEVCINPKEVAALSIGSYTTVDKGNLIYPKCTTIHLKSAGNSICVKESIEIVKQKIEHGV